jgi:hypothetical protein
MNPDYRKELNSELRLFAYWTAGIVTIGVSGLYAIFRFFPHWVGL